MKSIFSTSMALLAASVVSACITINIYFPASAAEKAADAIIDDVWQLKADKAGGASGAGGATAASGTPGIDKQPAAPVPVTSETAQ